MISTAKLQAVRSGHRVTPDPAASIAQSKHQQGPPCPGLVKYTKLQTAGQIRAPWLCAQGCNNQTHVQGVKQ